MSKIGLCLEATKHLAATVNKCVVACFLDLMLFSGTLTSLNEPYPSRPLHFSSIVSPRLHYLQVPSTRTGQLFGRGESHFGDADIDYVGDMPHIGSPRQGPCIVIALDRVYSYSLVLHRQSQPRDSVKRHETRKQPTSHCPLCAGQVV